MPSPETVLAARLATGSTEPASAEASERAARAAELLARPSRISAPEVRSTALPTGWRSRW